jgi:hypothetical protein
VASTPLRLWSALLAALIAAALLAPAAAAQSDAPPASDDSAPAPSGKLVLAYYYTWWEPERISDALFTPAQLPDAQQLSGDTALLRKHMQEAKDAGIDGWIVNRVSDLQLLLPLARAAKFTVTLQLDMTQGFEDQLAGFYQYVNDPAMVRSQGHAVLFFWQSGSVPPGNVQSVRDSVDPNHTVLWIADGDNFNILHVDAFDGISPYAIAWSANPRGQLASWGAKARVAAPDKLYIPPVSPGCDDHLVRAANWVRDRGAGSYYDAAWLGAIDASPAWAVVVSTWNEWLEATQIEPSVQYGDQYLQMTRQYADSFKKS